MTGPVGNDRNCCTAKIFIALHYLRDIYAVELAGTARPPPEQASFERRDRPWRSPPAPVTVRQIEVVSCKKPPLSPASSRSFPSWMFRSSRNPPPRPPLR